MRRASIATLTVLALALTLVLAGCSSPTASHLDRTAAQSLSTVATNSDQTILQSFQGSFQPLSLARVQGLRPQAGSCSTQTPTSPTDADSDGIPLTETTTYDCGQATDGYDASGTIAISDHNDNDPTSGWEEHIDHVSFSMSNSSSGSSFSLTANGDLVLDTSSTPYTLDANYTFGYSSGSASGSMTIDVHPRYTPASTADPFVAGSFVLDGTLAFSDGTHSYSLHRTSNNLTYDAATCPDTFDGGSVTYADGAGNTLTIHYSTSCTQSFTYNSQPL